MPAAALQVLSAGACPVDAAPRDADVLQVAQWQGQPTKSFTAAGPGGARELVINLKTAKALGITIPQSLLLRADEVNS